MDLETKYSNIDDLKMFTDITGLAQGSPIELSTLPIGKGYKAMYHFLDEPIVEEKISKALIKNNQMGVIIFDANKQVKYYLNRELEVEMKLSGLELHGSGIILLGNSKAQNTVKVPLSSVPLSEYDLGSILKKEGIRW